MDKTVNSFFNTDEDTEVSDVFNLTFDNGAWGIIVNNQVPGVGLKLFHAQGNPFGADIDIKNYDLDIVANRYKLGGVLGLFRPGHLGNMNKSLDSLFQLNEYTVIGDADNLAVGFGAYRIGFFNS